MSSIEIFGEFLISVGIGSLIVLLIVSIIGSALKYRDQVAAHIRLEESLNRKIGEYLWARRELQDIIADLMCINSFVNNHLQELNLPLNKVSLIISRIKILNLELLKIFRRDRERNLLGWIQEKLKEKTRSRTQLYMDTILEVEGAILYLTNSIQRIREEIEDLESELSLNPRRRRISDLFFQEEKVQI